MAKYVFPKIDLPKVGRSNFNLDKSLMFSFSPGTIRCLYAKDVLPKDHWEIDIKAAIESFPMLAPLYGKWKARWSWFFEPYSNIYGWMDNNTRRSTEEIIKSNLLCYTLPAVVQYDLYANVGEQTQGTPSDVGDGVISVANYRIKDMRLYNRTFSYPSLTPSSLPSTFTLPYGALMPYEYYNNLLGVGSSSIWEDFGWPVGWNGYWTRSVSGAPIGSDLQVSVIDGSNVTLSSFDAESLDIIDSYVRYPEVLHAVKPFGYLDIIRNYYVNNQFGAVPFIRKDETSGDVSSVNFVENYYNSIGIVEQDVLDYIFKFLRNLSPDDYENHFEADVNKFGNLFAIFEQNPPHEGSSDYPLWERAVAFLKDWCYAYCADNGGCFLSSYMMDLNKGLMSADTGDFQSVVNTQGGSFTIETFRTQYILQDLVNILDITRGRFSDWLNGLWSVDIKGDIDKPIYLGSHTEVIGTTDIVSTTSVPNGSTAGQQTGFSAGSIKKHRKIKFNSDQYGVIYCIFEFVPYVSYSRGFKREDLKRRFTDIYNPRMAHIGYQDVPQKVLDAFSLSSEINGIAIESLSKEYLYVDSNWLDTNALSLYYYGGYATTVQGEELSLYTISNRFMSVEQSDVNKTAPINVVGRQVAWAEYMTDLDEVRGDFALGQSLENWVLSRSYRHTYNVYSYLESSLINDIGWVFLKKNIEEFDFSTYIHPSEYNSLFVDTRPDAQNFRQFIKFDVFVKRAIPSRTIPHI